MNSNTLSLEKIKKIANGSLDITPYLNDAYAMYLIIRENPSLSKYVSKNILASFKSLFEYDLKASIKDKQDMFYYLVDLYQNIPYSYLNFIEDKDYFVKLASKNMTTFLKLAELKHSFKKLERDIFNKLYEDKFAYNPDYYTLGYALYSPKVLLNTLIKGDFYYINYFKEQAYNQEVIDYIVKNNILNKLNITSISLIPKLTIAKLKISIKYLKKLPVKAINEEVMEYLERINFNLDMLELNDDELKNFMLFKSSNFMMLLLSRSFDNIKYLKDEAINQDLVDFLVSMDYVYRENDPCELLKYSSIIADIIQKGDIDIILNNDVVISNKLLRMLIYRIKNSNFDIKTISNSSLVNNMELMTFLKKKYHLNNPYQLANNYLFSNVGRSIEHGLCEVFSRGEIMVIIEQIVKNNFYIDMEGILKHISANKFRNIYDKLYHKESKFNKEFNFYYFIKVTSYFTNNLSLLRDLGKSNLDDNILSNLLLAINNNDVVGYSELINYNSRYKEKIDKSQLSYEDKICYLLVSHNYKDTMHFLDSIISSDKLIYLGLQFTKNSLEYQVIKILMEVVLVLEKVKDQEINIKKLYDELKGKHNPNYFFNLDVIQDNIMRIYANLYRSKSLSKDKLRKKGCSKIVSGVEIFHIEGEDFFLYSHRENFNDTYDFTDSVVSGGVSSNYVCTTFESRYSPYNLCRGGSYIYEMDDISNLIAFGNKDIFISHTKKPLFRVENSFTNPVDMCFSGNHGYTPNEFDFLRMNNKGELIRPSFIVCESEEEAVSKYKNTNTSVIVFDRKKNDELVYKEFLNYLNSISKLSFLEMYTLIYLAKKNNYSFSSEELEMLIERIGYFNCDERYLITKLLAKFGYMINDSKNKRGHNR